jgi:hypothetical protein
MKTSCARFVIFCLVSFAIGLILLSPCSYARPHAEPPPQPAQQPSGQQPVAQQPSAEPPSTQQPPAQQPSGQQPSTQQSQPAAPNATPAPTPAAGSQKSTDGSDAPSKLQADQGTKDRLFFALPNFLSLENSAHVPPMTVKQKFQVSVRSSFDWFQYPWYGALAGISQARNSEPGYGQGAEGYAKRYASQFADGTIENFMVNAVVPSLLHTDPRYYQLGKGSVLKRTGYALSRLLITRTDSGHNTFNTAEIGGSFAAAAISTYSYHPEADKTFSNTTTVWAAQVGYDAIRIVLNEFWPDLRRKFHKSKSEPQP